jgi:twinkle protein
MQFMITRNVAGSSKFDKFDVQDIAIEKFRKFSTQHNVHVTLVVHPRKEDETFKLNMSSFYGSAKATQEADTVVILQNDGRRKYIEVKKNRFDGTLGYAPLYFQSKSGRYVETEGDGAPAAPINVEPVPQNVWKSNKRQHPPPPEADIPGLDNHWVDCLGPK